MKRKKYDELLEWKKSQDKKPLILLGCRQVGKTHLVKEFGQKEYELCVYLNFADSPEDRLIFNGDLSGQAVMDRIILSKNVKISPGRTLLIFDELQECDNAFYSLKPLSSDKRIDIIATGSFLGILLDDKKKNSDTEHRVSPIGYAKILKLSPMDFEEFLWAMGLNPQLIPKVKTSIDAQTTINPLYNSKLTELYKRYIVVGGMPAAVMAYSETTDYSVVAEKLNEILSILKIDAGKYSSKKDIMRVNACLESIPSQLAKGKQFRYAAIEKIKGAGKREYDTALNWLENAGIIIKCNNLSSIDPPLNANVKNDQFKIYLADTGLLMALSGYSDVGEIVNGDPFTNNGTMMENAVAEALHIKGYPLRYYAKKDSSLEVDFVIKYKGAVCILEVKSGRNKRSKSLNTLLSETDKNRLGLRICEEDIATDRNGAVHMPLYVPCLFDEPAIAQIDPVDIDGLNSSSEKEK